MFFLVHLNPQYFLCTVVNLGHGYFERGPVHLEQSDALYEKLSEIEIKEPGVYEVPKAVSSDKSEKEEWTDDKNPSKKAFKGIQLKLSLL